MTKGKKIKGKKRGVKRKFCGSRLAFQSFIRNRWKKVMGLLESQPNLTRSLTSSYLQCISLSLNTHLYFLAIYNFRGGKCKENSRLLFTGAAPWFYSNPLTLHCLSLYNNAHSLTLLSPSPFLLSLSLSLSFSVSLPLPFSLSQVVFFSLAVVVVEDGSSRGSDGV